MLETNNILVFRIIDKLIGQVADTKLRDKI